MVALGNDWFGLSECMKINEDANEHPRFNAFLTF